MKATIQTTVYQDNTVNNSITTTYFILNKYFQLNTQNNTDYFIILYAGFLKHILLRQTG